MKFTRSHRFITTSACVFSLAIASSLLPVSAQTTQGGSTQPSSTQGGSTQPSSTPGGSMQTSPTQDGSMQTSPTQGGSLQNGSTQDGSTPMQSGNRRASLNAVDRQFMINAAQSDLTEIQTSQLALKRSQNPQVRQYAQEMIQHHTQSSRKLKPLAAQKGVTLPTSLGAENQALLTQLTKLSGTQFDQAYMNGQVKAHAKTQAFYQNELKQGQDPDVKAFASQVLPIVVGHLRMAQNMIAGR